MKIEFPNWGYIIYALTKEMGVLSKNDTRHLNSQFNNLDRELIRGKNLLEIIDPVMSNNQAYYKQNSKSKINIKSFIANLNLGPNEFVTVFDNETKSYSYVDKKIKDILNIEPAKFKIEALLGLDQENQLYHHEDINHYLRYGVITYLVLSLKGFEFIPLHDYIRRKYRITIPSLQGTETYLIDKKSYLFTKEEPKKNALKLSYFDHIDVWNISLDLSSYKGVELEYQAFGNSKKANYLKNLSHIYNARILGFTPKELFILNLWSKFYKPTSLTESINEILKNKKAVFDNQFSSKQMSDQLYRLKLKLSHVYKSTILNSSHTKQKKDQSGPNNPLIIASKMGLILSDDLISNVIISSIEIEDIYS